MSLLGDDTHVLKQDMYVLWLGEDIHVIKHDMHVLCLEKTCMSAHWTSMSGWAAHMIQVAEKTCMS